MPFRLEVGIVSATKKVYETETDLARLHGFAGSTLALGCATEAT
jgi:hypothetical protein